MSEKNFENKSATQSTNSGFTFEQAWSGPEHQTVRKEQISMEAAPGREAAASFPQSLTYDWTFRRDKSGAIAHLKEGDNLTVAVRKDYLGDNITGYSFKRHINNAIIEERLVVRDLGQGRFTGMEDTVVYSPSEKAPRMHVREAIAGSVDNSVMTNIDMTKLANPQRDENRLLTNKMALLNGMLGAPGVSPVGDVIQDASLDLQGASSFQPGGFYTNLAGQYVKPIKVPVQNLQYFGYHNGRPQDVPVQNLPYNGYSNGRPQEVPVQNLPYNGYSNGRPQEVPVQNLPYNGYSNGRPQEVPVQNLPYNGYSNGRPQQVPVWAGGRNTRDGSLYNHIQVGRGRNTHDGSLYQHIPCSGNMQGSMDFRKPSRPLRPVEAPVEERPPQVMQPAVQKPTFMPIERKPIVNQLGPAEGESSNTVKTDVNGQVLPFKKPGER